MFVSLEPLNGYYIDVYPEYAQTILQNLQIGERIYLGPDCFNATIERKTEYEYIQYTPAISSIRKRGGSRSVINLLNQVNIQVYLLNNKWSFFSENHHCSNQVLNISESVRQCGQNIVWQWSSRTEQIFKIFENDWISYGKDVSDEIESSYQNNSQHLTINIGLKQYEIKFIVDDDGNFSTFGTQTNRSKRRWVRRAFRNLSEFEAPTNEESCALCLEKFSESAYLPWVRTQCNHVFHAVCLDGITDRCPMCRRSFIQ